MTANVRQHKGDIKARRQDRISVNTPVQEKQNCTGVFLRKESL